MTAGVRFVADCVDQELFHAVTVRSPIANGRLFGLDIPRLPSTCMVIRAADIPGSNRLEAFGHSLPILADGNVSYIGEPVALLVGPNQTELERLAEECVVRVQAEKTRLEFEKFSSDQLAARRNAVIGDPETAFNQATRIVEGVYRTGRQEHWYPEPQGAFARFTYDKLEISVATQWPFHVRRTISATLDVRQEDIVVIPLSIIANLDGKLWYPSLLAAQTALAALLTRHSVKLLLTREEDALYTPKRPEVVIRHRAALSAENRLVGLESRIVVNLGANAPFATEILDRLCLGSIGAYHCPNLRIEGFAVHTDTVPACPFAGFGLSQAFFAIERHVSRIAEMTETDPVEWRKNHALSRNRLLPSGVALKETVPADALIDAVMSMSGYRRKWAAYELLRRRHDSTGDVPRRGIGLSFAYQGNGFLGSGDEKANYSVELTLGKDSSLEIRTSAISGSGETATLWRKTAAEILGIDENLVLMAPNRTDRVPDSGPSSLSRNITIVTKLIERCCHAIRKQRFRDPLPITVQRSYRIPRDAAWKGLRMEGSPFSVFSWAAAVVETELPPNRSTPQIRGVWLFIDGGRILSEKKARSALSTAIQHALGWACREELPMVDGHYQSDVASNYDLPVPSDQPPITIDFFWTDSTVPKGIGELPFACVPAAYAEAVSQAVGHQFDVMPVSEAVIFDAREEA